MIGYLGTVSLAGLLAIGAYALPAWLIIPMAVANTFIGMHFPPEKAAMARARGLYTRILLTSFPLHVQHSQRCSTGLAGGSDGSFLDIPRPCPQQMRPRAFKRLVCDLPCLPYLLGSGMNKQNQKVQMHICWTQHPTPRERL
jgi:hypothetical protein